MMLLSVLIVIAVLILAVIVGVLLTPITLWAFIKILDVIAHLLCKIAYSKRNEINSSKNQINKVKLTNYGLSFGPFKIGVNEPIYNGYITYLNNRGSNNLKIAAFIWSASH